MNFGFPPLRLLPTLILATLPLSTLEGETLPSVALRDPMETLFGDAYPGPTGLAARGNLVYFNDTNSYGTELWATDGTVAGTRQVADIAPGPLSSLPFPIGGDSSAPIYLFRADSSGGNGDDLLGSGTELWRSDGTAAGTRIVRDLLPGPENSAPFPLLAFGGKSYFIARVTGPAQGLYETDGTEAGTLLVKRWDEIPGAPGSIHQLASGVGRLWLVVNYPADSRDALWTSDGTPGGTSLVQDFGPGSINGVRLSFVGFDANRAFLRMSDPTHGSELWTSDGGPPVLFKDLVPGAEGSSPAELTPLPSGIFLFRAHGDLWRTDGTPDGTVRIPGPEDITGNDPRLLVPSGNFVYFPNFTGEEGFEIWRSDGTEAGTFLLGDILPGAPAGGGPVPYGLTDVNGTAYFMAGDRALWKSGGEVANTVKVADVALNTAARPAVLNGIFHFSGLDSNGPGLFRSDGTPGGTLRLHHAQPKSRPRESIQSLVAANGLAFFPGPGPSGDEMWRSNGTPGGTFTLGVASGTAASPITRSVPVGGGVVFPGHDPVGDRQALYFSDGTLPGTRLIRDLGSYFDTFVLDMAAAGGRAFFDLETETNGIEPWRSDATLAGTVPLGDLHPGPNGSFARDYFAFGGDTFFAADDGTHGVELWEMDAAGNAALFLNLAPDTSRVADSHPRDFADLGNGTFLFAASPGPGLPRVLWISDGSPAGTAVVPCGVDDPRDITALGPLAVFSGRDGISGREPWISDGTTAGTRILREIRPGSGTTGSSFPRNFVRSGTSVYFVADDGIHGAELWMTDGTEAGTAMVTDIYPGRGGSTPEKLIALDGNRIAFTALDATHGRELWISDGTPGGTCLTADLVPGAADPAIDALVFANGRIFWYARLPNAPRPGLRATPLP